MDKDFERQAHFLIAKDPDGNAVLVRATSDGRLMTDGSGGSGPTAEYFNVIGGISATKSADTLIFEAGEGIQIVPDQINHKITFAVTGGGSGGDIPIGTLDQAGIVRLSSTLGEDETTAATPKLVTEVGAKALYAVKVAETDATLLEKGRTQLYNEVDLDSDEFSATASAIYKVMQYVLSHVMAHANSHLPDGDDPLPIATVMKHGLVKISNAVTSDSKENAATSFAVKTVMDAATKVASISDPGQVQLSSALDLDNETLAATAKAIKTVYDVAKRVASLNQVGQVKLSNAIDLDSDEVAATASAIKQLYDIATRVGTSTTPGQVKVDSVVTSDSTTIAASLLGVKTAYDKGVEGLSRADDAYALAQGRGNGTYYVDGILGNDSNNGTTPSTPFKTISYAINQLNNKYGRKMTGIFIIRIAGDQTYQENVNLTGLYGGGLLTLTQQGTGALPIIGGTLTISRCSIQVDCLNLAVDGGVIVGNNIYSTLSYVEITKNDLNTDGISVSNGGTLKVISCKISNRKRAISCSYGKVISLNNSGSGNTVGLYALLGGEIVKVGNQAGATTAELQTDGGLIRG